MTVQVVVEYEGGERIYLTGRVLPSWDDVLWSLEYASPRAVAGHLAYWWAKLAGPVDVDLVPDIAPEKTVYLDPARQWIGLSEFPGAVEWWLPVKDFETKVYEPARDLENEFSEKSFWGLLLKLGYEARGTVTE